MSSESNPSRSDSSPSNQSLSRRELLAVAGTSVSAALAGCSGESSGRGDYPEGVRFEDDWLTFAHDDANTGYDPDSSPASKAEVAWRSEFGVPTTGVTVAGDTVFVPTDQLRAVDAVTGKTRWTYPYDLRTPPAVLDGVVYVPHSDDAALVGLDVASGEEGWRADLPDRPETPPVFSNQRKRLFVALSGGTLCGIDREEGGERGSVAWTRSVFGEVSAPLAFNLYHLFAVTSTGELYCFTETGNPYWRHNRHAHLRVPPVVGDERVYLGGMDGTVAALDRRNGSVVWEYEGRGAVQDPMALDGDRIYAASGGLVAIDAESGERAWRYESGEGIQCSPVVVGDTVFVGTDAGSLIALDADGGGLLSGPKRWSVSLGDYVGHWLAAADGRVYAPVVPPQSEGGSNRLVAIA